MITGPFDIEIRCRVCGKVVMYLRETVQVGDAECLEDFRMGDGKPLDLFDPKRCQHCNSEYKTVDLNGMVTM